MPDEFPPSRRPGLDPAFRLHICAPCRAGDHRNCRPYRDEHRRFYFCECFGPFTGGPSCIEPFPEET